MHISVSSSSSLSSDESFFESIYRNLYLLSFLIILRRRSKSSWAFWSFRAYMPDLVVMSDLRYIVDFFISEGTGAF